MREQQCFFIIEKSEETNFRFKQNFATIVWFWPCIKMKKQEIMNLLGNANSES